MNRVQTYPTYAMQTMDRNHPHMGSYMGMMSPNAMNPHPMYGASMEPYQLFPSTYAHPHTNMSTMNPNCHDNIVALDESSSLDEEEEAQIPYPQGFVPTVDHVICGRGKKSYGHCGNKHFLQVVSDHMEEYAKATTKQAKSDIVQAILDTLDGNGGGFVRLCPKTGLYFQAEPGVGREKTSQALRDCLNHKYKSSKDIKRKNRKEKRLARQAVRKQVTKKPKSKSKSKPQHPWNKPKPPPKKNFPAPAAMVSPTPRPLMRPTALVPPPVRSVSSTSMDMATAAAAASKTFVQKPISPSPVLGRWVPPPAAAQAKKPKSNWKHREYVHLIQTEEQLEPLPFQPDEKLPELQMGSLVDFLL